MVLKWVKEPRKGNCAICEEEFSTFSATKKYCSQECVKVAQKRRHKSNFPIKRKCVWCGTETTAQTCSTRCQIAVLNVRKWIKKLEDADIPLELSKFKELGQKYVFPNETIAVGDSFVFRYMHIKQR